MTNGLASQLPPGYKYISNIHARAAIAFTPDLDITRHTSEFQNDRDIAAGVLNTDKGQILIASIYCDINKDFSALENASTLAKKLNYPLLAGADSNAWSELWGPKENGRGRTLEELLLTEGIDVENRRQNIPTFDNGRGSSFIDLTLSRDIPGEIRNWSVKRSEDSDHNYIHCELNLNSEKNETQYWKETDWEAYTNELLDRMGSDNKITRLLLDRAKTDPKLHAHDIKPGQEQQAR